MRTLSWTGHKARLQSHPSAVQTTDMFDGSQVWTARFFRAAHPTLLLLPAKPKENDRHREKFFSGNWVTLRLELNPSPLISIPFFMLLSRYYIKRIICVIISFFSILLANVSVPAYAQTGIEPVSDRGEALKTQDKDAQALWELGVTGIGLSQQAYPGSEINVNRGLIVPYFLYRGENFRVDRGGTGYRAIKTPRFEFDIGFAGAFGSSSDKITARKGMASLGTLIEFGPRFKWNISDPNSNGKWRFELPLRGVFDLSHRFKHKGITLEPELNFERKANGGWRYSSSISAIIASQEMAETFYQVNANEVAPSRGQYYAKQGLLALRFSGFISHAINNDLRIFGGLRVDTVVGAKNENSPLVKKKTAPSVLFGLTYTWMRSDRREFE
jgi:outer membrane protein